MQKLIGSCSSVSQKAFNENPVVFIFILYGNVQVFEDLEASQFYSFFKNSTTHITPNSPRHCEPSSRLNLEMRLCLSEPRALAPDSNLASLQWQRLARNIFGAAAAAWCRVWRRTGQATGRTLVTCAKLKTVSKVQTNRSSSNVIV